MKTYPRLGFLPNSLRIVLFISLALFLLGLPACSKSSKGSGDGEQVFSDQDLALNQPNFADGGNIPTAQEGGLFADVRFDYDSSLISPDSREQLKEDAKTIMADSSLHAEIEGHCDKRGTNEYNLALGAQRAKAVAALLVSYGVNPAQLSTISYGEEIPLDPAENDQAYAKNRRVHFALYRNKKNS